MSSVAELTPSTVRGGAGLTGDPVDLAHLRRYTLGNTELEREVLDLFAQQAVTTLGQLRAAATHKAWHEAAHTLKGAALAVGAWRVAAAGQQAEAVEFVEASREAVLPRLEHAVAEARAYIRQGIALE